MYEKVMKLEGNKNIMLALHTRMNYKEGKEQQI